MRKPVRKRKANTINYYVEKKTMMMIGSCAGGAFVRLKNGTNNTKNKNARANERANGEKKRRGRLYESADNN